MIYDEPSVWGRKQALATIVSILLIVSLVAPIGVAADSSVDAETSDSVAKSHDSIDQPSVEQTSFDADADVDADADESERSVERTHDRETTPSDDTGESVSECRLIDASGTYALSEPLSGNETCLEISADDVTLDGNDFSVSGDGTGSAVVVTGSNVTVENVNVDDWQTGIELGEGAADVTVRNSAFFAFETGVALEEEGSFGDVELTGNEFVSDETADASAVSITFGPDDTVDFGALEISNNAIAVEGYGLWIGGHDLEFDSITVADNEIDGGYGIEWYGLFTVDGTVSVARNAVSNTEYGIWIESPDPSTSEASEMPAPSTFGAVEFHENVVTASDSTPSPGYYGIDVIASESTFEAVEFHENVVTANEGAERSYGISLYSYGDASSVERVSMTDNTVDYNGYGLGVSSWESEIADIEISGNVVNTQGLGTWVELEHVPTGAETVSITDNQVTAADGTALRIDTDEGASFDEFDVSSNLLTDSAYGLFIYESTATESITVRSNDFDGNSEFGLAYDGDGTVDAVDNWWGAENGPGGTVADPETKTTASGDGDNVSENVLFDPWLESPQFESDPGPDDPPDEGDDEGDEDETESGPEVVDAFLSDDRIEVGETVTVSAVVQAGEEAGTVDLSVLLGELPLYEVFDFRIDGPAADGPVPVTVEANETKTVELEIAVHDPMGPYPIFVDEAFAGELKVVSDDEPGPEPPQQLIIDEPGVYNLEDLLETGEPPIVISADDVTLEGNGMTLTGEHDWPAIVAGPMTDGELSGDPGSVASIENVTVRDLTIENAEYGVLFGDVDDGLIEDVTVTNASEIGIGLGGVTESTVRHTELRDNRYGVVLDASNSNTLENNTVVGAADDGFVLAGGSSENALVANTVTDDGRSPGGSGFYVEGADNVLEDNLADGLYSDGFSISGVGNTLENNTARDSGRDGFRFVEVTGTVVTNATATGSDTHGIHVLASFGNEFEGGTASDNGGWDVYFSSGSDENTVSALTVGESAAETTVSADGRNVGITGAADVEAAPEGMLSLGTYFVASDEEAGGSLTVELQYDDSYLGEIDAETLSMWRYDAATAAWSPVDSSGVDVDDQVVTATLESFSTFGVFGEADQGDDQEPDPDPEPEPDPEPDPDPASFDVTSVTVSTPAVAGGTLEVTALVENTGEEDDEQTLELLADGEVVDSTPVSLAAGDDKTVVFEWSTNSSDAGESVALEVRSDDDETTTTVALEEAASDDVVVYGATVDRSEVLIGETVTVSGDLLNGGDAEGTKTVALEVDGEAVDETAVSVPPGIDRNGVTLEWTPALDDLPADEDGMEVTLSLNGLLVETVTVEHQFTDIQVIAASTEELELVEGAHTYVTGSIYQAGTVAGPQDIALTATHQETGETHTVDTVETALEPGFYHLGALKVSFEPDQPGTYDLELGDRNAGTVEVVEAVSDITVIAASPSEIELVEGEHASVTGSIYQAGNIDGPEEIELTATNTETNETEVVGTQEDVELEPGFYHLGALNISFEPEPGTYDLELGDRDAGTIEVEPAGSDIQVIAAGVSAVEAVEGDELSVTGSIYQAGNIDGPETIELTATNIETNETEVVGTQADVTLEPGFYHLGALNVSFTAEPGTYDLALGDRDAGTVEIEPAESDIQVIAAAVSEVEAIEGEELSVTGSIYQAGTIDGPEEIELTATNVETNETEVVGTQDVELEPGFYHLGALNVSFTAEPGTYDLALGDRHAGTIEVEPAESDIQVIAAGVSAVEAIEGEELSVTGSIYQAGNIDGPETIELTATNVETNETEVVGIREDVTLESGFYHLGALNVSFTAEPGTYDLALGDRDAGTVEIEPAESDITVIAAGVSEVEVLQDEVLSVTGSIYQAGNIEGPETIELTATNTETNETEVVGTQEDVTLEPGFYHLGALNISFTLDEPGDYDLELGDREVGTITVDEVVTDIRVIGSSLSEVEVIEGAPVHVTGSVYQNGSHEATETIELTATNTETGETEIAGSQDVTLSPGYYHLGALNVTFVPDEPGTYDLELGDHHAGTVDVEPAESDITVIAAGVSEVEAVEGDELSVTGSIYQAGTIEGPEEIELTATNTETNETEVVGIQEGVTLEPGFYHLGALNVSFTPDEPGIYDLELGDHHAGTVDVEPAESDIQVIAAGVSEVEAIEGDELSVTGSIYQAGTIEGPEEIELTATNTETNETVVVGAREDVTLEPGFYHLGALNVSFTLDEPGTYDLALGDRDAGTVDVEPAKSDVQVIAAAVSEVEAVEGDELSVTGSIYQAGTIDGPEEIELTATNTETNETEVLGGQDVTLEPGFYHLGALNVSFTPDEPGTYDLELGDRDAGTLEVASAESDIRVIAAGVSEIELVAGQEAYVTGSIYQAGTVEGPQEISLTATSQETGETHTVDTVETALEPGFYHLGALNVTFQPDEPGTYDLELGDRHAGTVTVTESTVEASIVDVVGYSDQYDPESETERVHASDEASVELEIDADIALETVTVLVDSLETTYAVPVAATHDGGDSWSADIPFADLPDDGRYTVSVVAVDKMGSAGTDEADRPLVIDREEPSMSVSLETVDENDATIVVDSDEPLSAMPHVEATFTDAADGSTADATVTMYTAADNDSRFTGLLEFEETGNYSVEVTGIDRAGNAATDTASVVVNTEFTLGDGYIVLDESGTTIEFDLLEEAEDAIKEQDLFVALSENSVDANTGGGEIGVGFLTAGFDDYIDYHLEQGTIEQATISMAIDDDELPVGTDATDVGMYHYDEPASQWNPVDSTIEQVGGDPFVVASVDRFSTYGALVIDDDEPTIERVTPTDGGTLEAETDDVDVRFEYGDELSGVDVGSVTLAINGEDVTAADGTQITATEATHALEVEAGETYTATVTVSDRAENTATDETTFEVADAADDETAPGDTDDQEDGTDDRDDGDETDDADLVPGFGVGLSLLVIALSVVVLTLRRR